MESTQGSNAPKKHWKTIEKEKREAEFSSKNVDPVVQKVPQPSFQKKKPSKFIRAFEQEYYYYVMCRVNKSPSITNARQPFFPQRYSHPGVDVVTHPETRESCTIRYVPGQSSIFKDEQRIPESTKGTPIIWEDGLLKVHRNEKNLKLFLDLCNANKGAKNRDSRKLPYFFLYDPKKTAEKSYNEDIALAKALVYFDNKCSTDEGVEDLMAYAKTLGLSMDRELSEIKADLSSFLKRDPKKFLEGLDNPSMKRKYVVMEALDMGILMKDSNTGAISWPSGQTLTTPPIGKDPVEYFVQWTFDVGQNTFDHLREETEKMLLERI